MDISEVKKILILGAGTMGQQIGLLCAFHKFDVVIYDIEKGKETIRFATLQKVLTALNIKVNFESPLMEMLNEKS